MEGGWDLDSFLVPAKASGCNYIQVISPPFLLFILQVNKLVIVIIVTLFRPKSEGWVFSLQVDLSAFEECSQVLFSSTTPVHWCRWRLRGVLKGANFLSGVPMPPMPPMGGAKSYTLPYSLTISPQFAVYTAVCILMVNFFPRFHFFPLFVSPQLWSDAPFIQYSIFSSSYVSNC